MVFSLVRRRACWAFSPRLLPVLSPSPFPPPHHGFFFSSLKFSAALLKPTLNTAPSSPPGFFFRCFFYSDFSFFLRVLFFVVEVLKFRVLQNWSDLRFFLVSFGFAGQRTIPSCPSTLFPIAHFFPFWCPTKCLTSPPLSPSASF